MQTKGRSSDMKGATIPELLRPFARSIYAKASALKDLNLEKSQRARLLEAISDDIKKCTNFISPEVSRAALNEAARLTVDLRSKNWHNQRQFDPDRKMFHFEHILPVSAMRQACLDECSEASILDILKTRLRVAWILKTEDAKLTRLGYRSKRDDPDAVYSEVGIELVECGAPHLKRGR